jgi:hypothetical protein
MLPGRADQPCGCGPAGASRRPATSRPGRVTVQRRPAVSRVLSGSQARRPPLEVVGWRRGHHQDGRDRTSGPVPAATRWGRTTALRTASGGLDGGETCPLMFFQQPAKLGVLRAQGSLCFVHTAMVVDRQHARQDGPAAARAGTPARAFPKAAAAPGAALIQLGMSRRCGTPARKAPVLSAPTTSPMVGAGVCARARRARW